MAKQVSKGDTFGFAIGTVNPGPVHVGVPEPAVAERNQRLYRRSQAVGAGRAGGDRGGRVLGRARRAAQDPRPRTRAAGTRSSPASSVCGSRARGISPVSGTRRSTSRWRRCRGSSSSRWSGRCPTSTRSRSRRSVDRAKRDAAWTHIRWMTDHVAEWTLKAGQVSAIAEGPHRPADHRRSRPADAARPGAELAGGAADAEVGGRREPDSPVIESVYIGAEAGEGRDGGSGPPDQRPA